MRVIGTDPYLSEQVAREAGIALVPLDELLRTADVISLHAFMSSENYHMIGEEALEKMKETAYLINCARGGLVDEQALYRALKEGRIAGAALDVFEQEPPGDTPLAELDNVTLTPHIGANTVEAQVKAGTVVAEQVLMVLCGEEPTHWVNRPR
jgi:D-3-phosphoglycerate dehydrogenase